MKLSRTQANMTLLLVAFIWGTSYTFIKQAIAAQMPPGLINVIRGLIFALLIYLFFYKTINKMTRNEFRIGLLAGIINYSVVQLQTTGLILMTESLFASLISVFFGMEQLTKQLVIGGTLIIIALVFIQFNLEWLKNIFDNKKRKNERQMKGKR